MSKWTTHDPPEAEVALRRLYWILRYLKERDPQAFALLQAYLHYRTFRETGRHLDIPTSTVHDRYGKAVELARQLVRELDGKGRWQ